VTVRARSAHEYLPYDDNAQPPRYIDDYPRSQRRTPLQPLIRRPLTRSELTGPTGLERKLRIGPSDLSRPAPNGPPAIGQLIDLGGRVLDENGAPVRDAILEMWQANGAGKYVHELDRNDAPLDPNFYGAARLLTDAEGRYRLRTIKPGAYPVAQSTWEWRAPHIHVSIFGGSWMNRVVTQLFFPGEWLNSQDLLLNAIPSENARERLIARPLPTVVKPAGNTLEFNHDFVVRGRQLTPTLIDDDMQTTCTDRTSANLTTGPFFPPRFLDPGCDDLTQFDGERARGTAILLTGRVLEEGGGATVNTIVEVWQTDANGVFRHPDDPCFDTVDPGFAGWGRTFTNQDGWYSLQTVMPGSYTESGARRCPHMNVMLLASGILRPLVTTVFFGDPESSPHDPILAAAAGYAPPGRLFAVPAPDLDRNGLPAYRFDILLRGGNETPFFVE
jgi:protocatechuate 3,4-dioxygenase beta subunit